MTISVSATLVCVIVLGLLGRQARAAAAWVFPQALINLGDRDLTTADVFTTREQIGDLVGKISLMQTEEACLDAIQQLNSSYSAADEACLTSAMDFLNGLGSIDELDAASVDTACPDYTASCSDSSLDYVSSFTDAFTACNIDPADIDDPELRAELAMIQLGAALALTVRMMADVMCLQVDGEYCGSVISEMQNEVIADFSNETLATCDDQLMNNSVACSAECDNVADSIIDAAGCCYAGVFGLLELVAEAFQAPAAGGDGNDDFAIEPQLCGKGFGSCSEMTALFSDAGIELTTSGATRAVAPTAAGATLALLVTVIVAGAP